MATGHRAAAGHRARAPTGRTPIALYRELVAITRTQGLDWSRVRTFNLDEFVGLSGDTPGSYRRFMHEHLFAHVNIAPEHIGFLDGRAADLDAECERYERAIAAAGGIDLVILGIGANGHIGFNEPASELAARTHRVALEDESRAGNTLWFGGDINQVPREALSMGMATILERAGGGVDGHGRGESGCRGGDDHEAGSRPRSRRRSSSFIRTSR